MSQYIQPPLSEHCEWLVEPPDTVGWFPADTLFPPDPQVLRYHFGDGVWSVAAPCALDAEAVEMYGATVPRDYDDGAVLWSKPWWQEVAACSIE